ncbi:anti-sigma factor family protein [Georgenia sp. SUBG003]|uniref:anti-sigma factor family protein n=1 Tax=Georgenia sp. SUBG003 TaxID=1497974 RepID=UPI003AB3D68D
MSHLRDDLSALVDGQLPPERAEAAMAHLVTCDRCAGLVAVERASRSAARAGTRRPRPGPRARRRRTPGRPCAAGTSAPPRGAGRAPWRRCSRRRGPG